MLIKEMRIQGPGVKKFKGTHDGIKILITPGSSAQLMIAAQRQIGEPKVSPGEKQGPEFDAEVTTLFRSAVCTVRGQVVESALEILPKQKDLHEPDLTKLCEVLEAPMRFARELNQARS